MNLLWVIKEPVVTEKAMKMAEEGVYVFRVDSRATKGAVRAAMSRFFGVTVRSVRVVRKTGGARKVGRRRLKVRQPDVKKVYITLKQGEKLDNFSLGRKE